MGEYAHIAIVAETFSHGEVHLMLSGGKQLQNVAITV